MATEGSTRGADGDQGWQDPAGLADRIKVALGDQVGNSALFQSDSFESQWATPVCQALLKYCFYEGDDRGPPEVFDDPYVGAALMLDTGEVLGAWRKASSNEAHAEIEAILGALEACSTAEASRCRESISSSLDTKIWLQSSEQREQFLALFAEAGKIIRSELADGCRLVLVSTLEPCRDFEAQPSCASSIAEVCPDLVIYACDDTNAAGQGRSVLLDQGLKVLPNVAVRENLDGNILFYTAVHYLERIQSVAASRKSDMQLNYLTADLCRIRRTVDFVKEEGRIRLEFPDLGQEAIYQPPHEPRDMGARSPEIWKHLTPDPNRALILTSMDRAFIEQYFNCHDELMATVPGIIICPRRSTRESEPDGTSHLVSSLKERGVKIYEGAFARHDETLLALETIRRNQRSMNGAARVYCIVKRRKGGYDAKYDGASEVGGWLRQKYRGSAPARCEFFLIDTDHRNLLPLVHRLSQAGRDWAPFRDTSFVVHVLGDRAAEARSQVVAGLREAGALSRFTIRTKPLHDTPLGAWTWAERALQTPFDPVLQRAELRDIINHARTWEQRQAAGIFLAQAVDQDPELYRVLITRTLVDRDVFSEWEQTLCLLNAIARARAPGAGRMHREIKQCLIDVREKICRGLNGSQAPPESVDLVWRYLAAALRISKDSDDVEEVLDEPCLIQFIAGSPFLIKEALYYSHKEASITPVALEIFAPILKEAFQGEKENGEVDEHARQSIAIRLARFKSQWNAGGSDDAIERIVGRLPDSDSAFAAYEIEQARCKDIHERGLDAVLNATGAERGAYLCTYLYLRTADSIHPTRGLPTVILDELYREGPHGLGGSPVAAWRGDRTPLARMILSEVSKNEWFDFLEIMARDEDPCNQWAALAIAMTPSTRHEILGTSPSKAGGHRIRENVTRVVDALMESEPHYWLPRELLSLFRGEHAEHVALPLDCRLTVLDLPKVRDLLRLKPRDVQDLHTEVQRELTALRDLVKRITLVLPPLPDSTGSSQVVTSSTPPLGLGQIATTLLSHGHDVDLFDLHREPVLDQEFEKAVRESDYIGFNVVFSTIRTTEDMTKRIEERLGNTRPQIVLGGHAPTLAPEVLKASECVWDYMVLGDGERACVELVHHTSRTEDSQIAGVITPRQPKGATNRASITSAEWDAAPWIDRRIFRERDGSMIEPAPSRSGRVLEAHINVARGCMWGCSFCTEAILRGPHGEVRRTAGDVINEIEVLIKDHQNLRVQFIDDNVFPQLATPHVDRDIALEWTRELLDGWQSIKQDHQDATWRGIMRFEDYVTYASEMDDWANRLAESGCKLMAFGVESGNEDRRKSLKGGSTLTNEAIKGVLRDLADAGIATKGFFIIGGPGDGNETAIETINFACDSGFTLAYFALYKEFRAIARAGRQGDNSNTRPVGPMLDFASLATNLSDAIRSCGTPAAAEAIFGHPYDMDRLNEAKEVLDELEDHGFRFYDLFKYNDYHDIGDQYPAPSHIWPEEDGGLQGFLQMVRRAYFEFYTREGFPSVYGRLLRDGY